MISDSTFSLTMTDDHLSLGPIEHWSSHTQAMFAATATFKDPQGTLDYVEVLLSAMTAETFMPPDHLCLTGVKSKVAEALRLGWFFLFHHEEIGLGLTDVT